MPAFQNLAGLRFGMLEVVSFGHKDSHGASHWICRCDCGNTASILSSVLKKRTHCTSAVHKVETPPREDLVGKTFARLTVLSCLGRRNDGRKNKVYWLCRCQCGSEKEVAEGLLIRGGCRSCGCLQREAASRTGSVTGRKNATHGMCESTEYVCWKSMVGRCTCETAPAYRNYGARGITVCERWLDFAAFYEDMGPRPSPKHTLDRFPNAKGNYEPGNCRWATPKEQLRNRPSYVRMLTINGETACVSEWAERSGVSVSLLFSRINNGWSPDKAISTPIIPRGKRRNVPDDIKR